MIMYTFFEENAEALSGKTLVPFSTHEGSGLSGFDNMPNIPYRSSFVFAAGIWLPEACRT